MADRHRNRDAEWWRAYRQANADRLRAYWRERARAAYIKKPRLRVKVAKPSRASTAAYRAARAAEVEARVREAVAAELERARASAELAALMAEQERDDRRYSFRHGPWVVDGSGSVEWVA